MHAILLLKMAIHIWRLLNLLDYVEIKISFKCHKTTLFFNFDILLYKTKKRRKFMNELKECTEKMFEDIKHID